MPTSTNVPNHLLAGIKTGMLSAPKAHAYNWQRVAMQHNMSAASETLVDLGATPMPLEDKGGPQVQDMIERSQTIKSLPWSLTTFISYNAMKDAQDGGTMSAKAKGQDALANFQRPRFVTI